jgi:hypothetical protein
MKSGSISGEIISTCKSTSWLSRRTSKMLAMLEAIHQRLGISDNDPEIAALEESTRPQTLVDQIETIIKKDEAGK